MKLPWRRPKPGEKGKISIDLPEDVALCVRRILAEKETQCKFNGVPFVGMTPEEILREVCSRLGNDWTVNKLRKSGLKL